MFIRRTKTANRKNGGAYFTYRLVRNDRVGDKVRQTTLLNLGADFAVPQEHWKELCALLEAQLAGRSWLVEPSQALASVAAEIIRQLQVRQPAVRAAADGETAHVRINGVEARDCRSAGGERLALEALQQLGFEALLRSRGVGWRDARLACALVIARMVHPSSEREAHRWLTANSATFELLGITGRQVPNLTKIYRIGDLLWRHRQALEDAFFARERELLGLRDALVFYDLTNTHFTGRPQSELAQFGHSKQKRKDCPLVTLALLLDAEGFPSHSDILPGNVSEPGTLSSAIRRFEKQGGSRAVTVVMDAGIATKENRAWLRKRGYHWITVQRGGADAPQREPDATLQTRVGHDAHVWRLEAEEGRTALCVWSQERENKDNAVLAAQRTRLEEGLSALHAGLSKKGHLKRLEKVHEKIGRLRERCHRVNRQYDICVEPGEKGQAKAVHWSRNALHALRDEQAGHYMLQTSRADWDIATAVRTYWKLTEIESTFRSLKSELGLRPVWHRETDRIAAHLFVSVLAYHAVHLLRTRLKANGIHDSWASLRNRLNNWQRMTIALPTTSQSTCVIRTDTSLDADSLEIARALGIPADSNPIRSSIKRRKRPSKPEETSQK